VVLKHDISFLHRGTTRKASNFQFCKRCATSRQTLYIKSTNNPNNQMVNFTIREQLCECADTSTVFDTSDPECGRGKLSELKQNNIIKFYINLKDLT
jgi:hypothetical protein